MTLTSTSTRRLAGTGAILAGVLASTALGATAVSATGASGANGAGAWSVAALDCGPGDLTLASGARVADGATAVDPKLYPDNEAKAYGTLKDRPRLADGSVTIRTVFHVISDAPLVGADRARVQDMVDAQMDVLNASFAGETSLEASDSPFRFDLTKTNYVVNEAWANVAPGKTGEIIWTFNRAGDFDFACLIAGHYSAGMVGKVKVVAAAGKKV